MENYVTESLRAFILHSVPSHIIALTSYLETWSNIWILVFVLTVFTVCRSGSTGRLPVHQRLPYLGCTQLDLWTAICLRCWTMKRVYHRAFTLEYAQLSPGETDYLAQIKSAADHAVCRSLPGSRRAHIYEPSAEARQAQQIKAYRWLNIAGQLGAQQIRIDSGGPPEMPEDVLELIVTGTRIDQASKRKRNRGSHRESLGRLAHPGKRRANSGKPCRGSFAVRHRELAGRNA